MSRPVAALAKALAVLSVVALGLIGVAVYRFGQPPFDLALLGRLKQGMTPTDVRNVLGDPSGRCERSWSYSGWLSWPIVCIEFDESGRLSGHRYDP